MEHHIESYLDTHTRLVKERLSKYFHEKTPQSIVSENLHYHLTNARSASFQDYYFKTLGDRKQFLSQDGFFKIFARKYSLHVSDLGLVELEQNKPAILELIDANQLSELYFRYFTEFPQKRKKIIFTSEQGSFFTKLVHTFKPDEYCALDNPVKQLLGLGHDGFYIAFLVISQAYREWSLENQETLQQIRRQLEQMDANSKLPVQRMTDLKLLDLILWYEAHLLRQTSPGYIANEKSEQTSP